MVSYQSPPDALIMIGSSTRALERLDGTCLQVNLEHHGQKTWSATMHRKTENLGANWETWVWITTSTEGIHRGRTGA
jgi:hypothetical protein